MNFLHFFCQYLVFFKPFNFGGFDFFITTYEAFGAETAQSDQMAKMRLFVIHIV